MYGWYFDFPRRNLPYPDYRRAIVGSLPLAPDPLPNPLPPIPGYLGTVRSFMHSITYFGLRELIRSFTTSYPIVFSYKLFDGWIMKELSVPQIWTLPNYWLTNNYELIGTNNISSIDVSGKTLKIGINDYEKEITFPALTNTPAKILAYLQDAWCAFVSIEDLGAGDLRIKFKANIIEVFDSVGSALSDLGLTIGFYTYDPQTTLIRGSVDLNTAIPGIQNKTIELTFDGVNNSMTFSAGVATVNDIINELQAVFGNYISLVTYGGIPVVKLNSFVIDVVTGTALPYLGLMAGNYGLNADDKRVVFMSKKFKLNVIRVLIVNWTLPDAERLVLERLIEWICPAGTKLEIVYGDNIWNPLCPATL
jgi:hypothetical protein